MTFLLIAAEKTETWICQGTAAGGLKWIDGKWEVREFGTRIYRVDLQGLEATISENNDPALLVMDCKLSTWSLSCSNDTATLELNKEQSAAVFMRFFGGIYPELEAQQKDSIYVEALQCFENLPNLESL